MTGSCCASMHVGDSIHYEIYVNAMLMTAHILSELKLLANVLASFL